jgi:hypothetical protein
MSTYNVTPLSGTIGTQIQIIGTNLSYDPNPYIYIVLLYSTVPFVTYTFSATLSNITGGGPVPYTCTWTATITSPANGGSPVISPHIPISPYLYRVGVTSQPLGSPTQIANANFQLLDPIDPICFNIGTKISCFNSSIEVQNLKKGDLVKTVRDGFLPVNAVGKIICYNPKNSERIKSRLYILRKEKYPELEKDLIVTGCHSILVPYLSSEKQEELNTINGKIYVTDGMYRLPTYLDDKSDIYDDEYGDINVYHIALGEDEHRNYGIYANGLLVESCFIPKVRNQMTLVE